MLNIKNWLFLIFVFLLNGKSEVSIPRGVLAVYMMGAEVRLIFLDLKFTPLIIFAISGSDSHSFEPFFSNVRALE